MSSSADIETRILEMKLDNDEFEKGVRSTIKSLEDLEEKLELKDAGDGFDKVSKAANTVQFSNMERSLDAITDKFSLLGNVGLQALERISNKIVDVGERILKGLTIDPVMDGWNEFEMKTNSIQTIFGGISKQYSSPTAAFKAIGQELDALNEYADQTIYNFAQMTENVGKFTNQNIGLKTATKAIKGIGNWAALVGADSTQMSRAMYNISQSLGGGAMKLIDWKSIRTANMATPDVQKLFADIALAQGGLTDKKGNVLKKGSKAALKAYQTVIKDFEGSLKTGWLTNDIMMKAFGVLSGDLKGADLLKIFGDTEEGRALAAEYEELGLKAREAATQIKTFTQLVGVLKESLGSGWATSFEKLFGGFEKQRLFFTRIADIIGDLINKDTENRNRWIDRFTGNNQGTELLMDTIVNLITLLTQLWQLSQEVTQALIEPFGGNYWFGDKASRDIFGGLENNLNDTGMTAQHFAGIIADLNYALHSLTDWFHGERTLDNGAIEKATPAYENAKKIFAGLGSVVMITLNAIENLLRFGGRILALFEPLASSILNLFGNVGGMLYSIYQNIAGQHMFSEFFNNMYLVIGPVVDAIVEFLSLVADLIASFFDLGNTIDETGAMAENNKLGPFIKLLSDVFKVLPMLLAPVTGFLTTIVKSMSGFVNGVIKGFPAIKKHVKKEGVTPFQDLKDIVQEFIAAGFGDEAAKTITDWYNNNVKGTLKSLVEWFGTSYDSITTFFGELPGKITKLVERVKAAFNAFSNYNYDASLTPFENFKERMKQTILALFGEEIGNNIIQQYKDHVAPYIEQVAGMIQDAFTEVKRILNGIIKVFQHDYTGIDDPFQLLQTIALNFLSGYDEGYINKDTVKRRLSVMDFFKNLEEVYDKDVKPTIDKVLGWITTDIPNAFNTVREYLFGKDVIVDKGEGGLEKLATEHIPGLFDKLINWINNDGKRILNDVVNFFVDIWEKINRGLFGYDNAPVKQDRKHGLANDQYVPGHVNGLIDNIKIAYQNVLDWCNTEGASIVKSITDFIFGEETESTDANGNTKVDRVGGLIRNAKQFWDDTVYPMWTELKRIYGEVETWVTGAASTAVTALTDFIFGKEDSETKERSGGAIDAVVKWYNDNKSVIEDVFTNKLPNLFAQVRKALLGEDVPAGQNKDMWQGGHINGIIDILRESFGQLKEWIDTDGAKIWADVSNFIFGHEVVGHQGNTWREGGVFQSIQAFLDPIIAWIWSKGSWLYNYVTTHSFSQMWADLNELFLGHEIIGKQGNSWFEGGIFSDLINTLRPISDFFGRVGTAVFEKISSIDFGAIWTKLQQFFLGYETTEATADIPAGTHIPGLFDRLADLLDRIVTFFESDTWKNFKETIIGFFERYIQPIFGFLGGGFGELFRLIGGWNFEEKGFFGNLETILGGMSTYAMTAFPEMLQTMFPEGFNLGDVVGNLIPDFLKGIWPQEWTDALNSWFGNGGDSGKEGTAPNVSGMLKNGLQMSAIIGSNAFSDVVGLYGAYNERLAKGQESINNAQNTTKEKTVEFLKNANSVNDGFNENRKAVGDAIGSILQTIGSFFGTVTDNAGTIGTMIFGGIALSNISSITQSLTGHEKDSIIQDIADLFTALGDFLGSLAWLIGIASVSDILVEITSTDSVVSEFTQNMDDGTVYTERLVEKVNVVDHLFDKLTGFLVNLFSIIGGLAAGSYAIEAFGEYKMDAALDARNLAIGTDVTSISENIHALGEGLQSVTNAVGTILKDLLGIIAVDALLKLLPGEYFGEAKDAKEKVDRLDVMFNRFKELLTKLFEAIGGLMTSELVSTLLYGVGSSIFSSLSYIVTSRLSGGNAGLKTRFDSYASNIMAVGSFVESVAGAMSTILTTLAFTSLLGDYEKINSKLGILQKIANIMSNIMGAMSGLVKVMAAKDVTNALQDVDIKAPNFFMHTGGKEKILSGASDIGTYAKLFGFTALLSVLVLAVGEAALVIMQKHLASASSTIMVAASQIQAVIEAVSRLTPEQVSSAENVLGTITRMFTEMGKWTEASEYTVKQSTHFRDVLANAALGFESMGTGLQGYDEKVMRSAFESIGLLMKYFESDEGFDPAAFQGKMSFMALAGQNMDTVTAAFSSVTAEDVDKLKTVKDYFIAFQEIAEILSAMSALGNFGAGFMAFDVGFNAYSFMEFLAQVQTLEGRGDLKYAFEQIIEALPDSPELLQKLRNFSDAGGGSLGLFTSGIIGLTGALREYNNVMGLIGTESLTSQAAALDKIDKLGASLGEKDFNAIGKLNANTRLGLFANDVKALAGGIKELAVLKVDGTEYNFDSLGTFLERVNKLGTYVDGYNNVISMGDSFSLFVGQFMSLRTGFSDFIDTLSSEKFDKGKLDIAADFLERVVKITNLIPEEAVKLWNRNTILPDERNEVTQVNSEKLAEYLTNLATPLPTLGTGIAGFYSAIKGAGFDLENNKTAQELEIAANFIGQIAQGANYLNAGVQRLDVVSDGTEMYTLAELAEDLWREDGTGLFNVMANIFDFAGSNKFNVAGMKNANEAFSAFGTFSQGLSNLLNSGLALGDEGPGSFDEIVKNLFENGLYPSIQSMPVTEIQAYASAFSDLSTAMTMNGQAGMLAQAVDDALNALRDKEIEVRVTPVWNLPDNMPTGPIAPSWGFRPNITNDYSASTIQNIQFPAVQAVSLVPEELSAITRSAQEAGILVSDKVDDMNSALGGLRVQLDTGVLVGQLAPAINRYLGRNYQNPRYIIVTNPEAEP